MAQSTCADLQHVLLPSVLQLKNRFGLHASQATKLTIHLPAQLAYLNTNCIETGSLYSKLVIAKKLGAKQRLGGR